MIKENQKILNTANVLIDSFIIVFSYLLAYITRVNSDLIIYVESVSLSSYMRFLILIVPTFLIMYYLFKIYTTQRLKSLLEEVSKIIRANIVATAVLFVALYFSKEVDYSRFMMAIFVLYNIIFTSIYRIVLRYMLRYVRKKGFNIKRAFLIGTSDTAMDFLQKTYKNLHWGYRVIGIFEEKVNPQKQERLKKILKDNYIPRYEFKKLEEILTQKLVDEVVIGIRLKEYEHLE